MIAEHNIEKKKKQISDIVNKMMEDLVVFEDEIHTELDRLGVPKEKIWVEPRDFDWTSKLTIKERFELITPVGHMNGETLFKISPQPRYDSHSKKRLT